jgi:uncharacterized protein YjiS (DUF1127 family)
MRTVSSLPSVGGAYPSLTQRARRTEWWRSPKAMGRWVIGGLRQWRRRSRDRAQLAMLDDRMLRDIGLSRGDVLAEINKPFWRR